MAAGTVGMSIQCAGISRCGHLQQKPTLDLPELLSVHSSNHPRDEVGIQAATPANFAGSMPSVFSRSKIARRTYADVVVMC
jgi:hypothetical protein